MKKKFATAAAAVGIAMTLTPAATASPISDIDVRDVDVYGNLATAHALASDGVTPVVILGARLDPWCTPPGVLNERMDRAASFLRVHPFNPVIVTGGQTIPGCVSEAAATEAGLRLRGVINPIYQENRSGSTVENARNVANIRPERRMVLVSSADHLPRAKSNFAAVGIDTAGAALM